MSTKYIKNALSDIIENYELTEEVKIALNDLREKISDDLTQKEKFEILIKWISIFKDVGNLAVTIQKLFE
ncbi:hypothetical protein Q73A0000_04145 [Kaistella flava (ex Peng et al. 2021)]|uniref:Uncharacterized protein n=1 Tax=Kaistella flava (ex Peng et al. 2021) TaxID=2038776 RepID=A0A7M2Y8F1_9FLAO|nr:hypothetical protein [Kaistella flava (ex Peng et al. 2021)]QOW09613.1 hypothetical protein Q73A0000_04145 [Kaistella flava (ex Peng et al. 2021)]